MPLESPLYRGLVVETAKRHKVAAEMSIPIY